MKFGTQSSHSTTPSPPRATIPFPAEAFSTPASPLAALIPGFLRRPTQSFTRPRSSRSRSSSIVTATPTISCDSAASTCPSSRASSEEMGLLDDDPFAAPWDLGKPVQSLPTSPLGSPTREKFLPIDSLGHAVGQSLRFPSLNNESDRIEEDEEEEADILPLHRRDRSYTLKAHPRKATWKSDKPAFRDRPALPPLSILAQQNIVVVAPKSSRARHFPSEPWDKDISELPPLPRAKSLSPVAQQRAEPPRRLSELNGDKDLPPLPRAGDAPSHPSPIAEEDESGPATEYDDEFEEEDDFEYEECVAPPSSPDYSFLEDLEEDEEAEEQDDALDATLPSGAGGEQPQVPRETLTASVAIAVSLVQESHGDMLRPPSQRPNTLSASPAPSSCLLPSPNFLPLPELSPRTSGSASSGDTEGSVQAEEDGTDTYTSYWKIESQQIVSFSTAPLPCSAHRHMSWDLSLQAPTRVTTITSSSFSTNFETPLLHLLRQTGRRALSFSPGDKNPYTLNTTDTMATSSRAQSYGAYARPQQHDFLAARHLSHGANGAGRDVGRVDRDPFGRKSLDAGMAGDDRRRRVPYGNSSAVDDEEDDEDDMARYGAPEHRTARRGSESLRVPRQSSSRPSSSRSSASKLPPVPPLPSQYQPAASPRPEVSPRMSPTHSRNHSGSHAPPSAFHAPHHTATVSNPPTPSRPSFSRSASRNKAATSTESTSSDSDDVPLAQRIPTALTAQKSIRKKARDDRDKKAVRAQPAGLGLSVAPDELASKLLGVQQQGGERGRSMTSSANVSRSASRHHTHGYPSPNMRRLEDQLQSYQIAGESKPLHHARSVRRTEDEEHSQAASRPIPRPRLRSLGPSSERPAVMDSAPHRMPSTRSRPASPDRHHPHQSSIPASREPSGRSMSQAPSVSRTRSRANTVAASDRNHTDDHLRRARTVRDPHAQEGKTLHTPLLAPALPQPSSRDHSAGPPPPASPIKQTFADSEQLRIFIGDLQRFVNVEITSTTTAEDVIEMVSSQGELSGRDWMLWELANEFGMERPIRDYERLSDVFASWNKECRLNALMLKQTPLAVSLSRKYLPNSSPTFSGYVQWEVKKGKWQKRWMELREHSLFLCKKDNGKDAAFLCALSSFDAYVVKRVTRAPKPFVFAVKSTESIAMFENPADCVHIFSCESDEGRDWLEKILLARSYVLYQERNVLFRTQRTASNSNPTGASVQRSNTRRNPHQPLIPDVAPSLPPMAFQQSTQPARTAPGANVFAEGSLLARPTPQF